MSKTSTKNAEKYLISSVLRNGDLATATKHGINASMFHSYSEEWAWVENFMLKHKKSPGKTAFRTKFPEFPLRQIDDTSHWAEEVKRYHSRFLLLGSMEQVGNFIAEGDIEQAVSFAYTNIIKIAGTVGVANDGDIFSDFEDILTDAKVRLKRVNDTGFSGIPTGFITLDERTGGPGPGDFWTVAARLGEGKSFTMQRMATTACMHSKVVQYDALEQTRAQVTYRVHAFMSSAIGESIFRTTDLMQGRNFSAKEYKRFLHRLKKEVKGKLHVSDTSRGRVGLMTIASQIERNRPDIVFIDYLTLMDKKGAEWQDVAALSAGVKSLAGEYNIPIVAAAQLNRANGLGGKEPAGAEALAQSDAIGQDSDFVLTMKQTSPKTTMMKAAKNRNGEGGFKFYTHFDPGNGVFEEVSWDKYQDLKDSAADEA